MINSLDPMPRESEVYIYTIFANNKQVSTKMFRRDFLKIPRQLKYNVNVARQLPINTQYIFSSTNK